MIKKPKTGTVLLVCITYVLLADLLFGDVLKPLFLATVWSDRLGAPNWYWFAAASLAVGSLGFLLPARLSLARGPLFVVVGLAGSAFTIGTYADHLRSQALDNFGAERIMQQPFAASIRNAPAEHQFFLHAAALKHCVPYGWSYRTMSLYRIPAKAAVNVLPPAWITQCSIHVD